MARHQLQMERSLQIDLQKAAANILNKQLLIAGEGLSSSLVAGRGC